GTRRRGSGHSRGRATGALGELARTGALDIHLPTTTGDPLPPTRPGDVLVPLIHDTDTTPTTHVIDHTTPPPTPPERHTALLRPNPQALDPWFLAGFLRASHNTRQASSYASSATRIDIRRLKVPRIPLAEQQRYGRRFAELATFETTLQHAADLGRRLTQGTIDALTQGTLPPGD
ncbi:SAM-dependent methyltransferase, partial [Streptomyces hoynatensis]